MKNKKYIRTFLWVLFASTSMMANLSKILIGRVKDGDKKHVEFIVENGSKKVLNCSDKDGKTPLILSIERCSDLAHYFLEKGADPNLVDNHGNNALHNAIMHNCVDLIEPLLKKGVNVNAHGDQGNTALHYAALLGKKRLMSPLIKHGADINAVNDYGDTPLHFICRQELLSPVVFLVKKGALIHVENNQGNTPLHIACLRGNSELIPYLCAKGAYIDAKNEHGNTPMHFAVKGGSSRVLEALLAIGSDDIYTLNNKKETPITWAMNDNKNDLLKLLVEQSAMSEKYEGRTPIHIAVQEFKDINELKILCDRLVKQCDVDIDIQDLYGETPLHVAVRLGREDSAKVLVDEYGADSNKTNEKDLSPRMIAEKKQMSSNKKHRQSGNRLLEIFKRQAILEL